MEFHANNWSDLIALRPLLNAALCFICRKDPILSTAIVARPAKAGMKAAKPLFVLKSVRVEKYSKILKAGLWNQSSVQFGQKKCAQMIH